jgi:hypothetical protein
MDVRRGGSIQNIQRRFRKGWDYREILGRYRRFGGARVRYVRSGMRYAGMGDL